MELTLKKTIELTEEEIKEILSMFNSIMHRNRSIKEFKDLYLNTVKSYSYHVMLHEDGELIGFHSVMPFLYKCGDVNYYACLGIDTMTHPKHRDFFNFRDMIKSVETFMAEDGCKLRFGFPNDNAYPVLKKGLKYKDIGKLDTYFLPLKIGGVKPSLKVLNPLSQLFCWMLATVSHFSCSKKVYSFKYGKDRSCFDESRYKWFGAVDYKTIEVDGVKAYYKTQVQEGVKTLFILDVWPLSKCGFDKVVRAIYSKERKGLDMIMYVGHLPFVPLSLVKMPHKFEPKHFNFTCKSLVKDFFDDSLYDINNWDVNLSNYDLL